MLLERTLIISTFVSRPSKSIRLDIDTRQQTHIRVPFSLQLDYRYFEYVRFEKKRVVTVAWTTKQSQTDADGGKCVFAHKMRVALTHCRQINGQPIQNTQHRQSTITSSRTTTVQSTLSCIIGFIFARRIDTRD
jgi:hypothetical protein